MKRSVLAAVVVLGFCGSAFAQVGTPERVIQEPDTVKYKKVDDVTFGEAELRGGRMGPSGAYDLGRRKADFENRIQLRTNFTPELQGSVDSL